MKKAVFAILAIIFAIAMPFQFARKNDPVYIDTAQIISGDLNDSIEGGVDTANENQNSTEIGENQGNPEIIPDESAVGGSYGKSESDESVFVETGIKVQVLVDSLNVRTAPTTSAKVLGSMSAGAKADYIAEQDGWYKIRYGDEIAFVSANTSYTRLIEANAGKAAAMIDAVIDEGIKVLGTPYEFGSQRILLWNGTLNKNFTGNTFDCSAFVQYAFYKGAGIKLNGDSRSQSIQGIPVPLNQLQKGDVIFMTSSSRMNNTGIERIGHVALYIGNNKILHTFGTGGVRIQDYSEFWKGRAISARRMVY